ncbi:hypothetical protein NKR23_g11580 [Pleurostoma richardsiae]|uniref:Apple domain-containing protein n=1 Tax=Pleurostoma richardsiae TaxID=41990 RepID=A0AA38RAB3_9PEZI|nr:hypothetical protein NKR23_g11580 [Pleurostoma richardsiae]
MNPHQQVLLPHGTELGGAYYYHSTQGAVPEKGSVMSSSQPTAAYPALQDPHYQQYPAAHSTHAPQYSHPAIAPAASLPRTTILGMKKSIWIAVFAITALLLALIIGLGAGLGVSQRNLHKKELELATARANASAAESSLAALATVVVTLTHSSTATFPSTTAVPTNIDCPASNNTFYTSNSGGRRFERFCGIDYSGKGQADDLGSVKTTSMDLCMDACAKKASCTGCGWGVLDGDTGDAHSCWLKANLSNSHNATADWAFAVLLSH